VIRQDEGRKRWRITENLSYVNAVDIQFVDPLPECPEPTVHTSRGDPRPVAAQLLHKEAPAALTTVQAREFSKEF
jgi:hypothetical protein